MAYQKLKKQYTFNNKIYELQYDSSNGKVQLIEQNAPTGTQPIFYDGSWNSTLTTQENIPQATQLSVYGDIQDQIKTAYTNAGGRSNNLILPQWALNGNNGTAPGTSPQTPQQASPNSGNPGSGGTSQNPLEGFTQLWQSITNPGQAFGQVSVTNGGYGPSSEIETIGGTHKYPIDMQIKHQDYVHITQYSYQPPQAKTLLQPNIGALINEGFQKDLSFQKSKIIGHVFLPMPNEFVDSMDVGWTPDTFNNLSAAALAHAMNNIPTYGAAMLGGAGLNRATGGGLAQGAQFAVKGIQAGVYASAISGGQARPEGRASVSAAVLEQILAQGFFAADADSILSRTAGVVANNNLELMFGGPKLREFSFAYKMTARDEGESRTIKKILRFFKQGSRPKKKTGGLGEASYFLATPNVFRFKFCLGGGAENTAVSRIKTCACTGIRVNYNGAGPTWTAYEDGQPVSVDMTLTFAELEPIFDTDYQEDVFQDFRGAIDGVRNDAVGY